MSYMPYVPMRSDTKEVSQDRMQEILKRRSKEWKPETITTPAPKEKSDPLQWHPPIRTHEGGAGYMASQCGRFSISKDGHKDTGFTYTAWRRLPPDARGRSVMPVNLGCVRNLPDAKTLCALERDRL